ncbi:mediator complex, subunit Med7, partial [Thamnocephalis sphaerospora]
LSAAFPPPPPFYKDFTSERLAAYRAWCADTLAQANEESAIPAEFAQLQPPPPPTAGTYLMFGEQWPVIDEAPSLKDAGILQLYTEKASAGRADELKRLNRSLVFNFLELVDTLINAPEQYPAKIDHFRLILNNMYALINEYRPLQARETLKMMLRDQIERKQ